MGPATGSIVSTATMPVNSPFGEHLLRSCEHIRAMVMGDQDKNIAGGGQGLLKTCQNQRRVPLRHFGHQHADGVRLAAAQVSERGDWVDS